MHTYVLKNAYICQNSSIIFKIIKIQHNITFKIVKIPKHTQNTERNSTAHTHRENSTAHRTQNSTAQHTHTHVVCLCVCVCVLFCVLWFVLCVCVCVVCSAGSNHLPVGGAGSAECLRVNSLGGVGGSHRP